MSVTKEPDYESVRRAEQGFNSAYGRLIEQGQKHHFVPLTEFCWWAISLDEGLREVRPDYLSRRNTHPHGQVVTGIKRIRNVLGHQRLIVTRQEGGLSFPVTFPISFPPVVARWVDAETLPEPNTPEPTNDRYYRQYVAGRTLDETADAVRRWLMGEVTDMNRESGYYD